MNSEKAAMNNKSRILFISRAYPPITGGIENQNYELSVWLSKISDMKTVANRHGRKFLPFFAPYALIIAILNLKKFDVLLLGDGTLAIIGWCIKIVSKKKVVSVIHGLDINYGSKSLGVWYEKILIFLYQNVWVDVFIKKIDKFIAVGNETVKALRDKDIPSEKIVFIPNGVDARKFQEDTPRDQLKNIIPDYSPENKYILTSGRLAKRKGVAWFCENVVPKLPENYTYIIAGDGPDRRNIEKTIEKNKLRQRVKLLGYVTDEVRNILFNTCDIFVQPNIKVPGDMEGFGISVIEAASCKIPVVASRLEGLTDAIKDGENGFLVESENAKQWTDKILALIEAGPEFTSSFGNKAARFVEENYSWERISRRYLEEIEK